jgi:hypothetical protein
MKKWILKAIIQKTISYFPFKHNINYFFQKYVTKGVNLTDEYFYDRLEHAKNHLKAFSRNSNGLVPSETLEIGTGWYPIVPIAFFLAGTEKINSIDTSYLIRKDRIKITLEKFIECYNSNKLNQFIQFRSERIEQIINILVNYDKLSLNEVLLKLNMFYSVGDARNLQIANNSIDLINSNNTFEHIYPQILVDILKEFKRVVRKSGGIMSHFIDMSDHFSNLDKTINVYNFLKFSEKKWNFIDNSIQPQNRLRVYDYKNMYNQLNIPITEEISTAVDLDIIKGNKLDKMFSDKPIEETAICFIYLITKFD